MEISTGVVACGSAFDALVERESCRIISSSISFTVSARRCHLGNSSRTGSRFLGSHEGLDASVAFFLVPVVLGMERTMPSASSSASHASSSSEISMTSLGADVMLSGDPRRT